MVLSLGDTSLGGCECLWTIVSVHGQSALDLSA
jgi:hypothetical protein